MRKTKKFTIKKKQQHALTNKTDSIWHNQSKSLLSTEGISVHLPYSDNGKQYIFRMYTGHPSRSSKLWGDLLCLAFKTFHRFLIGFKSRLRLGHYKILIFFWSQFLCWPGFTFWVFIILEGKIFSNRGLQVWRLNSLVFGIIHEAAWCYGIVWEISGLVFVPKRFYLGFKLEHILALFDKFRQFRGFVSWKQAFVWPPYP